MKAGWPSGLEADAVLDLMTEDAIKSSAIGGEILPHPDVLSSIRSKTATDALAGRFRRKLSRRAIFELVPLRAGRGDAELGDGPADSGGLLGANHLNPVAARKT